MQQCFEILPSLFTNSAYLNTLNKINDVALGVPGEKQDVTDLLLKIEAASIITTLLLPSQAFSKNDNSDEIFNFLKELAENFANSSESKIIPQRIFFSTIQDLDSLLKILNISSILTDEQKQIIIDTHNKKGDFNVSTNKIGGGFGLFEILLFLIAISFLMATIYRMNEKQNSSQPSASQPSASQPSSQPSSQLSSIISTFTSYLSSNDPDIPVDVLLDSCGLPQNFTNNIDDILVRIKFMEDLFNRVESQGVQIQANAKIQSENVELAIQDVGGILQESKNAANENAKQTVDGLNNLTTAIKENRRQILKINETISETSEEEQKLFQRLIEESSGQITGQIKELQLSSSTQQASLESFIREEITRLTQQLSDPNLIPKNECPSVAKAYANFKQQCEQAGQKERENGIKMGKEIGKLVLDDAKAQIVLKDNQIAILTGQLENKTRVTENVENKLDEVSQQKNSLTLYVQQLEKRTCYNIPSYFSITLGTITIFGLGYMFAQWLLEKKKKSQLRTRNTFDDYSYERTYTHVRPPAPHPQYQVVDKPKVDKPKRRSASASRGRTTKTVVPEESQIPGGPSGGRLKKTRKRKGKFSKKRQLRKIRQTGKRKHRKSKK